jgi:glutathione peroxidase-family protein
MASLYDIPLVRLDGTPSSLAEHAGKVLLIVNVASRCGLTPQYEGLENLYRSYRGSGLVVLGFPANDFAGQEPGTDEEIGQFCRSVYGVDFPMFAKIAVGGADRHPLYAALIAAQPEALQKGQQASIEARRRWRGSGRHSLELREVSGRPRRLRGCPLRAGYRARGRGHPERHRSRARRLMPGNGSASGLYAAQ